MICRRYWWWYLLDGPPSLGLFEGGILGPIISFFVPTDKTSSLNIFTCATDLAVDMTAHFPSIQTIVHSYS